MSNDLIEERIALVGCGRIGSAIVRGLRARGMAPEAMTVIDRNPSKVAQLVTDFGIQSALTVAEAVSAKTIAVIAVKPLAVPNVLQEISQAKAKLGRGFAVVSVASGGAIADLKKFLPDSISFARAMPNLAATLGASVTGIYAESEALALRLRQLFESIGATFVVERERDLDVVTAIGGSGPGYLFLLAEALIDAAVESGLRPADAALLASQTILGAGMLLRVTDESPKVLRERISTPGGTTVAGLDELKRGHFRENLIAAVKAATRRAAEIGQSVVEKNLETEKK